MLHLKGDPDEGGFFSVERKEWGGRHFFSIIINTLAYTNLNQMLKSIFISTFPLLCLIGLGIAFDQYLHAFHLAALGLVLCALPMLMFLAKLFLTDVARTSAHLNTYTIFIVLGVMILAYAFFTKEAEPMAGLGFILALFWLLYLKWYSVFNDRSSDSLKVGKTLPLLSFENEHGKVISSASFLGNKNILLFYRGNWCPLCVAQVKEMAEEYKALEAKGIQTNLISPQSHKHTKRIAKRFDVGFKFLIDVDNAVAKQLNIFAKNGLPLGIQVLGYDSDTVLPTIILTDEKGKIVYSDLTSNYRIRPQPSDLIKQF